MNERRSKRDKLLVFSSVGSSSELSPRSSRSSGGLQKAKGRRSREQRSSCKSSCKLKCAQSSATPGNTDTTTTRALSYGCSCILKLHELPFFLVLGVVFVLQPVDSWPVLSAKPVASQITKIATAGSVLRSTIYYITLDTRPCTFS